MAAVSHAGKLGGLNQTQKSEAKETGNDSSTVLNDVGHNDNKNDGGNAALNDQVAEEDEDTKNNGSS